MLIVAQLVTSHQTFIGTFTSNLTGGVLSIDFENTGINTATLKI